MYLYPYHTSRAFFLESIPTVHVQLYFVRFLRLFIFVLQIAVHPNFSAFLTVRPTEGTSCQLQPEVKALFRPVAMVMPDMSLILRSHCAGQGFKAPKVLADKLKLAADISKEQL